MIKIYITGPAGSGKTEISTTIARALFGLSPMRRIQVVDADESVLRFGPTGDEIDIQIVVTNKPVEVG